jgi:hypothetical protein
VSTLTDRIRWLLTPQQQQRAGDVPTLEPGLKDYGSVKATPLVRIAIYGNGIAYDEPLVTADGAPVSATGPGAWGQLYAAGRY